MDNDSPQRRSLLEKLSRAALSGPGKAAAVTIVLFLAVAIVFVPKMCGCQPNERMYPAIMKSDLRNLLSAQEAHMAEHEAYALSLSSLEVGYFRTPGVSITLDVPTPDGWTASASHESSSWRCVLFAGDVESPFPEAEEGDPYCWDPNEETTP